MSSASEKILNEVRQRLTGFLEARKLRKTPERYAILEVIYSTPGHYDVETLYNKVREQGHEVSRATVYNTLDLLTENDLVTRHQFGKGQALYERAFGSRQHDHLICLDCNRVVEFCDPRIQTIQNTVEELLQFDVQDHSLVLHAHCRKSDCPNRPASV
ncbi:MAG: Fur family transcriptional regulator [Bacteroidota bacterium]